MKKENALSAEPLTPDTLQQLISGFQKSRIILSAFELGIFTALNPAGATSTAVSQKLNTDPRGTDRLMNALCALGLLEKSEGRFSNTPFTAQYLVQGQPDYLAGIGHFGRLWQTWSTLTQAVKVGHAIMARPVDTREESEVIAFIAAMHQRASRRAAEVAALLDLGGVRRMLDVGGGSGAYAMGFAQAKADLRAVVFDLPNVVPLTRQYIEQAGLSDRVSTAAGDYLTDDLGQGFDLALLSAVVHSNSPAENRKLIAKCARALNPRGQLVIQDHAMDEDRAGPAAGALFAINMLVNTSAGDTYTEAEMRSWMETAGLGEIIRKDSGPGGTLLIGIKLS